VIKLNERVANRKTITVNAVVRSELPFGSTLVEGLISLDLAEVYSPHRVAAQARKLGLNRGEAFDRATGWDSTRVDHRRAAQEHIDKHGRM